MGIGSASARCVYERIASGDGRRTIVEVGRERNRLGRVRDARNLGRATDSVAVRYVEPGEHRRLRDVDQWVRANMAVTVLHHDDRLVRPRRASADEATGVTHSVPDLHPPPGIPELVENLT